MIAICSCCSIPEGVISGSSQAVGELACLPRFFLLRSLSDTLLVVSILDM